MMPTFSAAYGMKALLAPSRAAPSRFTKALGGKEGFTGTRKDKRGHNRCYSNGRPVPCKQATVPSRQRPPNPEVEKPRAIAPPKAAPKEDGQRPGFHETIGEANAWAETHGVRTVEGVSATPVSLDQLNYVNEQVAKIPQKALDAIKAAGSKLEIVGGKGITDHPTMSAFKGVTPRGWEGTGRTWDDIPGAGAQGFGGTTIVAARGLYASHTHGSRNLVLHEHGHTLDSALGGSSDNPWGRECDSPEWREIHRRERWATVYEADHPMESWAESFAKYYHSPESRALLPISVQLYFKGKFG